MLRHPVSVFGLLLASAVWAAHPAVAADHPLEAFPRETSVIVRVKKPQATIEKVATLVDAVQPGMGANVRLFAAAGLGSAISNPTQEGVDKNSDWWIGVFVEPNEEPAVVFAIPTKDAKSMQDALGEDVTFIKYEKWGIYCDKEDAAAKIQSQISEKGKSISAAMDPQSVAVMDQSDISVFVNVRQLTETYSDQLDSAESQFEALVESGAIPGTEGAAMNPQAFLEMVGQWLGGLIQGLKDTESCTLALAFSKQGVNFDEYAKVTADTPTAKWLKSNGGSEMKALSSLPAANFVYYGLHGNSSSMSSFGFSMMEALVKDDEDAQKALAELKTDFAKLDINTMVGSLGLGSPSQGILRTVMITEMKDPKKMRELAKKMYEVFNEVEIAGVTQTYDLKADAEKYGKYSADVLTVTQEFDENNPQAESQEKTMTLLYGPDGMVSRMVYLKDRVVQTMGGGKAAMTKALQGVEPTGSGATPPPAFEATRRKLGDKLNAVILIDLPGLVANGLKVATEGDTPVLPFPVNPEALKALTAGKPSFLGLALSLEPEAIRTKIVLPVEQLQGLAKFSTLNAPPQQPRPARPNRN